MRAERLERVVILVVGEGLETSFSDQGVLSVKDDLREDMGEDLAGVEVLMTGRCGRDKGRNGKYEKV